MAWVVLVTGGSRGFGRALALAFAANKASADDGDLHLYLWSRDAAGMAATAADVTAAWQRQVWVRARTSHSIHVTQTVVDLSDDSTYGPAIDTFLEEAQVVASVDRVVVVHNAGSLGQVGRIAEVASPQVIRRHMELNVNSVLWINKRQDQMSILRLTIVYISRLLQVYGTQAQAARVPSPVLYLINVSSLNAIEPFATCGLYCVFK
ncbi:hypothetical protein AaE_015616, partial [Aphanomyces astaci]